MLSTPQVVVGAARGAISSLAGMDRGIRHIKLLYCMMMRHRFQTVNRKFTLARIIIHNREAGLSVIGAGPRMYLQPFPILL